MKHFTGQERHEMVLLWTFYLLIISLTLVSLTADQLQFKLWHSGSQFVASNPKALLSNISDISSRLQCMIECLNNIQCRVINFDPSTQEYSLFSSWLLAGNMTDCRYFLSSTVHFIVRSHQSIHAVCRVRTSKIDQHDLPLHRRLCIFSL